MDHFFSPSAFAWRENYTGIHFPVCIQHSIHEGLSTARKLVDQEKHVKITVPLPAPRRRNCSNVLKVFKSLYENNNQRGYTLGLCGTKTHPARKFHVQQIFEQEIQTRSEKINPHNHLENKITMGKKTSISTTSRRVTGEFQ